MPTIRAVAICVFRHGTRVLVGRALDEVKGQEFFRPIGGSIEFGERAVDAVRREVREELRAEIRNPRQLGVLENLFSYSGEPGHEIVFVFDADFADASLYECGKLPLYEEVWGGEAEWPDLSNPLRVPLYPDGLVELLATTVEHP